MNCTIYCSIIILNHILLNFIHFPSVGSSATSHISENSPSPSKSSCKNQNEDEDEFSSQGLDDDNKKGNNNALESRSTVPLIKTKIGITTTQQSSDRAAFWDNVLSDDSDVEAGWDEGDDDECGIGYDDPQLDLDNNGEGGGCFDATDDYSDEEQEGMNGKVKDKNLSSTSLGAKVAHTGLCEVEEEEEEDGSGHVDGDSEEHSLKKDGSFHDGTALDDDDDDDAELERSTFIDNEGYIKNKKDYDIAYGDAFNSAVYDESESSTFIECDESARKSQRYDIKIDSHHTALHMDARCIKPASASVRDGEDSDHADDIETHGNFEKDKDSKNHYVKGRGSDDNAVQVQTHGGHEFNEVVGDQSEEEINEAVDHQQSEEEEEEEVEEGESDALEEEEGEVEGQNIEEGCKNDKEEDDDDSCNDSVTIMAESTRKKGANTQVLRAGTQKTSRASLISNASVKKKNGALSASKGKEKEKESDFSDVNSSGGGENACETVEDGSQDDLSGEWQTHDFEYNSCPITDVVSTVNDGTEDDSDEDKDKIEDEEEDATVFDAGEVRDDESSDGGNEGSGDEEGGHRGGDSSEDESDDNDKRVNENDDDKDEAEREEDGGRQSKAGTDSAVCGLPETEECYPDLGSISRIKSSPQSSPGGLVAGICGRNDKEKVTHESSHKVVVDDDNTIVEDYQSVMTEIEGVEEGEGEGERDTVATWTSRESVGTMIDTMVPMPKNSGIYGPESNLPLTSSEIRKKSSTQGLPDTVNNKPEDEDEDESAPIPVLSDAVIIPSLLPSSIHFRKESRTLSSKGTMTLSPKGISTLSPKGTMTLSPKRTMTLSPKGRGILSPKGIKFCSPVGIDSKTVTDAVNGTGTGAAYSTPGRTVIHVNTPYSARGFCVDLDSESESERTATGTPAPTQNDAENHEEMDMIKELSFSNNISPLQTSPSRLSRSRRGIVSPMNQNQKSSEVSPAFSIAMSPLSVSTISSALTSHSLSPHAVRALALTRLNLNTESALKVCPPTMAAQTGRTSRGVKACDFLKVRLAGTAFEGSPEVKPLIATSTPGRLQGDKGKNVNKDRNKDRDINEMHLSEQIKKSGCRKDYSVQKKMDDFDDDDDREMSEAGTLDLDSDDDAISCNEKNLHDVDDNDNDDDKKGEEEYNVVECNHPLQQNKFNGSRGRAVHIDMSMDVDEDGDEEECWVPESTRKQRLNISDVSNSGCGLDSNTRPIVEGGRLQQSNLSTALKRINGCFKRRTSDLEDSDDEVVIISPSPVQSLHLPVMGNIKNKKEDILKYDDDVIDSEVGSGSEADEEEVVEESDRGDEEDEEEEEEDEDGEDIHSQDTESTNHTAIDIDFLKHQQRKGKNKDENEDENEDEEHELEFEAVDDNISKCKVACFDNFQAIDVVQLLGNNHDPMEYSADKENMNASSKINFQGKITRSKYDVTKKEREKYNKSISRAQKMESHGELEEALEYYLEALEICDADASLHGKMAYLSQKLNFF